MEMKVRMSTRSRDRGAKKILEQLKLMGSGVSITTGIHNPQAQNFPRYKGKVDGKVPIGTYAAWQEFGNKKLPPRPFLAPTVKNKAAEFTRGTRAEMLKLYNGSATIKSILTTQGKLTKKLVKDKIMNLKRPSNTPSTRHHKKRLGRGTNPLIYSKSMYNSISSKSHMSKFGGMNSGGHMLEKLMMKAERAFMKKLGGLG
jgi:hypothetical protein